MKDTKLYFGEEGIMEELAATEEGRQSISLRCQELEASEGWQFLKKVYAGTLSHLQKQIVSKKGLEGNDLTEENVDTLRLRVAIIEELLEFPKTQIEKFTPVVEPERNPDDPYE